jgi:hypothetical protein
MHTLHLFLEGLLALSAISFCICACFIDDRNNDTPPSRAQEALSVSLSILRPVPMPKNVPMS